MGLDLMLSQRQGISRKMVQNARILQMNAQELREFLSEAAMDNPVIDLEERHGGNHASADSPDTWEESHGSAYDQYTPPAQDEDLPDDNAWSRVHRGETLREHLHAQFLIPANTEEQVRILDSRMLREAPDEETKKYLLEKMEQAEWVVECMQRRIEVLTAVTGEIIRRQEGFFTSSGNRPERTAQTGIAPFTMEEAAEAMHVHPSTVSRAVRGKYLQCEKGIFPLKYFFTRGLGSPGEKQTSAVEIKEKIAAMIRQEDPASPLSDEEVAARLTGMGVSISRRTAAKYREEAGIPGSRARKRLFARNDTMEMTQW